MNILKISTFLVVLLTSAVMVGCNEDVQCIESGSTPTPIEVVMPVDGATATRTALLADGQTTSWVVGDQIALWADGVSSNSSSNIVGEPFQLKYYGSTFDKAEFAGTISQSMVEQEYSYRAFYPVPTSIDDKKVSFEISSTQSGVYDGSLDFRVADPVTGRELTELTLGGGDALNFRSIMHVLKLSIPTGCNNLSDDLISRLVITMPDVVAGSASFDLSKTDEDGEVLTDEISLSDDAKRMITIDLTGREIKAGDGSVIWIFMKPLESVTGSLGVVAYDTAGRSSVSYDISLTDHTFSPGYITRVNATIGEEFVDKTTLQLNISGSATERIGEELTYLHFKLPNGAKHLNSESDTVTFPYNQDETYEIAYQTSMYDGSVNGSSIEITCETKSTLTKSTTAVSGITTNATNALTFEVPYLMYQNFDGITADSNYGDANATGDGQKDTSNNETIQLSTVSSLLDGWSANRYGIKAKTAMRICCHESYGTKHDATLKSAALSAIKEGVSVNLNVTYNFTGDKEEWRDSYWLFGTIYQGYTGNGEHSFASVTGSSQTNYFSNEDLTDSNNVYTNITSSKEYAVSSANSSTYFKWVVTTDKTINDSDKNSQNGNYWLYLDNIKVVIVE